MLYFQFGYGHTITIMLNLYCTSFLLIDSGFFSISVQPWSEEGREDLVSFNQYVSRSKGQGSFFFSEMNEMLSPIKGITFCNSLKVGITTDITCYNITIK